MVFNFGHKKSVTRWASLFDIKAWWQGESTELEKWLDIGFHKTLFATCSACKVYENKELRVFVIEEQNKYAGEAT